MKAFWTILAFVLGAFAVGGVRASGESDDSPTLIGNLVITGVLALGAYLAWQRRTRT
ncbi:hypothetical protein ACFQ6Q_04575 [Streptomyces sp. NPDC056437]|uniref:hypothetical protein n=1 Tax=Streptomyces sp. NPDC056437 TaxID=3345816 RepID=UPI0036B4CEDB